MKTEQFIIYGHVQGVGFRFFTWREAQRIGVTGWVKNQSNGSVAVLAQGTEQQLETFYHWLQQGPKTATVNYVESFIVENNTIYSDFQILH
ncbi:acylphosphatase [Gallibacterium genomosp. 3]|uniref:Acylphosphatase n=1 Tax=Gallibacterium genomosp. 3 TaxID=505345 RepID=A0A1A7PLK2_9PAST|nr:acylphosphatase [Gallibacterium genomosp. 3]OBX02964.1 acylphosphatase [Gallibacterium genomosp. 3]